MRPFGAKSALIIADTPGPNPAASIELAVNYPSQAIAILSLLSLAACEQKSESDPHSKPASTENNREQAKAATPGDVAVAQTETAKPTGESAKSTAERLYTWLDPDAIAAADVHLSDGIQLSAISTVYGLPPLASDMLKSAHAPVEALSAVLDQEMSAIGEWLDSRALVMRPPIAEQNYVVQALREPDSEVIKRLEGKSFKKAEESGFVILEPKTAFPWKIVLLGDSTVAFVHRSEKGTGLTPLTAARDLPESALEQRMKGNFEGTGVLVSLAAMGPMMHLDLDHDVGQVELVIRKWQGDGLDGLVSLQMADGTPGAAAQSLNEREGGLETDIIQKMMKRSAFTVQGPQVTGRLQLTAEDVRSISR